MRRLALVMLLPFLSSACSSDGTTAEKPAGVAAGGSGGSGASDSGATCAAPLVLEGGACVDPLRRYEPAARVDFNNVVSYGGEVTLTLPDPPKSGFRLIVPPRHLAPGDEIEDCHAWAYPQIQNKNIYAARVYTTGGLHHSNMFGVPLSAAGASPYPGCAPKQADVASQVPNMLQGKIMDVLFANSTQIAGGEQIVFPKGMSYKITTDGREVATTIHWLNVSGDDLTSEVVYDFFTMADADVETPIVPFVFENEAFSIPEQSEGHIQTTCNLARSANIVTIMPHTHKRATAFDVSLIRGDGTTESIFHDGTFDTESDITVFDTPISTEGFTKIHHECTVANDLAKPIVWGIGDNEMCTLFGYLYPPTAQLLGFVGGSPNPDGSSPACTTLDIGAYR